MGGETILLLAQAQIAQRSVIKKNASIVREKFGTLFFRKLLEARENIDGLFSFSRVQQLPSIQRHQIQCFLHREIGGQFLPKHFSSCAAEKWGVSRIYSLHCFCEE